VAETVRRAFTRRIFVGAVLALLALAWATAPPLAAGEERPPVEMQVILLGTGYPRPDPERAGPATAVVVGEKLFVVDAGRGVVMRLAATEFPLSALRAVFLTHLHSDHIVGLPDLFNTSWIFKRYTPLELYGPEGTRELAAALLDFFAVDIPVRRDLTEMHPGAGATINTHIVEEGVVYEDEDVRVTAFLVDHRPMGPAFGYRFDLLAPGEPLAPTAAVPSAPAGSVPGSGDEAPASSSALSAPPLAPGEPPMSQAEHAQPVIPSGARNLLLRSIVISGDTRPSQNLIKYAKGADLLIHEAYLPEHFDKVDSPEVAARLKAYHTSAEEVGQVAHEAGVKLLVLTHVVPGDSDEIFLERARKHFKGTIVVGRDLMRF